MMSTQRDVVITGIGMVTSLGSSVDTVWNSVLEGEHGFDKLSSIAPELEGHGVNVAAAAADFDLSQFNLNPKLLRNTNKVTNMLVYSGLSALKAASLNAPDDCERYNIGAIIGTGTGMAERYSSQPLEGRRPRWFLDTYPNLWLSYLSIAAGLKGYGSTVVNACASGTVAIGNAFSMIQTGQADVMLAGATSSKLAAPYLSGYSRLGMISPSDSPDNAMRPFDKDRTGFVLGEGACVLVLEEAKHAEKRQAEPISRIVGTGMTMDAFRVTDPSEEGKIRAMQQAMANAGIDEKSIDYVNAHATSTKANDAVETQAIKSLFGKRAPGVPINSTKSMLGHTLAASGAIEAAICAKSLQEKTIHRTRNFKQGCRDCDLDYVAEGNRNTDLQYCISNSSGIGGYNASLVMAAA